MSGICGIYRLNHQPVSEDELIRMNDAMRLLGQDGSGVWHSGSVSFGHQAFHLTHNDQYEALPHYDPSSRISITSDCRLDNRAELCQSFHLDDEPSVTDSSLILSAYKKWGKDCPKYLLGEFAVAIWDEREQALFCFVDHTGCRAFYYYRDANVFAFATEIQALHTLEDISRKPNLERIAAIGHASYLLNRPEMTCYENVFKIPARTLFIVQNKKLKQDIYWQPDIHQRIHFSSEEAYIEAFQALFSEIIRSKLRSHCPVMTLHSGGLDSSAITAMAAHLLALDNQPLTALSAVLPPDYQGETVDESHYIHLLKNPNLKIHALTDPWRGPFDGLDDKRYCMTGIDKTSRYYLYKAFATKASSYGARIILDGCFGEKGPSSHGNGYYAELLTTLRWRTLWRETRLHCKHYDRSWLKCMIKEGILPLLPAKVQAKLDLRSDIRLSENTSFIKSTFIEAHVDKTAFKNERLQLNTQYPNHRYHQHQAMDYLYAYHPAVYDDDQKPVYFSYPYQDKRLLEFCLAMPGNLKVHDGYKRYAIRSGMRGLMPDELRFRTTKEPFSPDFHDRYNRQIDKARDYVASAPRTPLMEEIIDFARIESAMSQEMRTNRCATAVDFSAMHTVPNAVYLMGFLGSFRDY